MDALAYIAVAATILGLIWAIVKQVVKLTPTKKDDEIIEKADPTVTSIVDALDGKSSSSKDS